MTIYIGRRVRITIALLIVQHGLPDGLIELQGLRTTKFAGHFAKVCKTGRQFRTKNCLIARESSSIYFPTTTLAEDAAVRSRQQEAFVLVGIFFHTVLTRVTVSLKGVLGAVERFGCGVCHVLVRTFFTRVRIAQGSERARYASVPQSNECKRRTAPMGSSGDGLYLYVFRVVLWARLACAARLRSAFEQYVWRRADSAARG